MRLVVKDMPTDLAANVEVACPVRLNVISVIVGSTACYVNEIRPIYRDTEG